MFRTGTKEIENPDMMLLHQGFVHQMSSFLHLVCGKNDGKHCSLRDAAKTLHLIDNSIKKVRS